MEIKSEVFGSCVEGINVLVKVEYEGRWLCCGCKYLRFILAGKATQNRRHRWVIVPGIGYAFKCFLDTLGVIEELKSPCRGRGLVGRMGLMPIIKSTDGFALTCKSCIPAICNSIMLPRFFRIYMYLSSAYFLTI
jgi:hypothetical protein